MLEEELEKVQNAVARLRAYVKTRLSVLFPVGARDLRLWGTAAVLIWLTTFSLGSLVPACPFRQIFDPRLTEDCSDRREPSKAPADMDPSLSVDLISSRPRSKASVGRSLDDHRDGPRAGDFILGVATYTPSNLAILALASGFLAGCAGRLMWAARRASVAERARQAGAGDAGAAASPSPDDDSYLRESPFASMFRSFVAYLLSVAGLLVISPEMFTKTTPEVYMRLAGLVSALAFAVGYDPRRLSGLLSQVIPDGKGPGQRGKAPG